MHTQNSRKYINRGKHIQETWGLNGFSQQTCGFSQFKQWFRQWKYGYKQPNMQFNIQEMIYKDIYKVYNDSADGLLAIEVGNIARKKRCCTNASKNATKYSRIKRGLDWNVSYTLNFTCFLDGRSAINAQRSMQSVPHVPRVISQVMTNDD